MFFIYLALIRSLNYLYLGAIVKLKYNKISSKKKASMFSNIANYIKLGKKESPPILWSLIHLRKIQDCVLLNAFMNICWGQAVAGLEGKCKENMITWSTVSKWIKDTLGLSVCQ